MDCKITALDANDKPILGVNITLDESHRITPLNGTVQILTLREERSTLIAYHPDYVRETVHFSGSIIGGAWDNALLEVQSRNRFDEANLIIRLGRCIMAPTSEMTDNEMTAVAQRKGDGRGVVPERLARNLQVVRKAYRGHKHDSKPVEVAARLLIPHALPPDEAAGWGRFETERPPGPKALVEVVDEGRFLWLMYPNKPSKSQTQYAVLVWSPNIPFRGVCLCISRCCLSLSLSNL